MQTQGGRMRQILAACATVLWISTATAADTSAKFHKELALVEGLHTALLDSMRQGAQRDFGSRRSALVPVLEQSFDFAFMAEKSAGRYWRELQPKERESLISAMSELAVSNYAARFNGYDGERFETTGVEAAAFNTVLVRTQIVQSAGTATRLDYRLRRAPSGEPRIVDVFLNGTVSELAMRRAEYSSMIKREGFDALLGALRDRVGALPVSAGAHRR